MNEFDGIFPEINEMDIDNMINDENSINLSFEQLKQDLSAIQEKNVIQCIDRSNYLLKKLEGNIFDGFYQIIDLNLSHNLLTSLPTGVFDQLFNLQTVNLSNNLITKLEDFVFRNNTQLRIINLSNNFLNQISQNDYYEFHLLNILNFSFNRIETLPEKFVKSESLRELYLGNNLIDDIDILAFWYLPNLTHLHLNNNCILYLKDTMFKNTRNIEYLNFSNNFIQKLDKKTFMNLTNLRQVDFSNNLLWTCGNCFDNKPMLMELNLLNNQIKNFRIRHFNISKNIRILKLTIFAPHILERLDKLKLLSDFELHVKYEKKFSLNKCVLPWINASIIKRLYLVIQKGSSNYTIDITNLFNLEFLHIEFLEPIKQSITFNILFHINIMLKWKYLALINLNKLEITGEGNINRNSLTYMNLTGIENESVDFLQNNFVILEHLNLSFSHVKSISRDLMSTLPNLKFLNMNRTMISVIEDNLFQYNSNLEVILFRNCQIHTIGENAFRNLMNLKEIDIRGNTQLRITQRLLNGIPKSAVVYYD